MFPLELPSGKSIAFKPVSFRERRAMAKMYNRNEGYLLEELLAANALIQVDGSPVQEEWAADPITRFDDWSIPDVQYYIEVFMTLNSLEDLIKERAQDAAKKLMGVGATQAAQVSGGKPKALKVNIGSSTDG